MTHPNWLDSMEALEKAATPGKWEWDEPYYDDELDDRTPIKNGWLKNNSETDVLQYSGCGTHGCEKSEADAAFIAASRTFVPKTIECIRELKTILLSIQADFGDKESSQRVRKMLAKWSLE